MGAEIDWQLLTKRAWAAREQAYAPYSRFPVGAALLTDSGETFAGCNVENTSFGLTICAERAAVSAAIQAGCRRFLGIAVVADTEVPVVPCGACRQVLAEFNPSLPVYSAGRDGIHSSWLLSLLLPCALGGILDRAH